MFQHVNTEGKEFTEILEEMSGKITKHLEETEPKFFPKEKDEILTLQATIGCAVAQVIAEAHVEPLAAFKNMMLPLARVLSVLDKDALTELGMWNSEEEPLQLLIYLAAELFVPLIQVCDEDQLEKIMTNAPLSKEQH